MPVGPTGPGGPCVIKKKKPCVKPSTCLDYAGHRPGLLSPPPAAGSTSHISFCPKLSYAEHTHLLAGWPCLPKITLEQSREHRVRVRRRDRGWVSPKPQTAKVACEEF